MLFPSSEKNTVLQLNMGEGKSSVIVPIIAAVLANGKQLLRVVVLKPLLRQMLHLLVKLLSGLVHRRIYYLPFSRKVRVGVLQAQVIMRLYDECLKEGGVLLIQPEHILSFKLMAIDRVMAVRTAEEAMIAQAMFKAQKWLDENTRDILDESDEILYVRYQLIYTVGEQQPLDHQPDRWTIIQEILQIAAIHIKDLLSEYPDHFLYNDRCNGQFPLIRIMPDSSEAVGELTRRVAESALQGCISMLNLSLLSTTARKAALSFLTERDIVASDNLALESIGASKRNGLLLLRGFLALGILAFTLSKKHYRVNYGLDLSRSMLAVPYHAKVSFSALREVCVLTFPCRIFQV